jgi:hypothetical protein
MGTAKVRICDIKWEGIRLYNGPVSVPHEDLLEKFTSIKSEWIYETLIKQRLTSRDGLIEIDRSCFPVRDLIYESNEKSERKRLQEEPIRDALDSLSPRREKACKGSIILKGKMISLVVSLEALLREFKTKGRANPFNRSPVRHLVIADWLNWLFQEWYEIQSNYSPEQVRQMLKGYNKYAGQFDTPIISLVSKKKKKLDLRNSTNR